MKVVNAIKLNDGSIHEFIEIAERRLQNTLSSGVCLEVFEGLSKKNALEIKSFFVDNEEKIIMAMQIVRELNELFEHKNK